MDLSALIVSRWDLVFLVTILALFLLAGIYAAAVGKPQKRLWPLAALMGLLIVVSLQVEAPLLRMILLDAAGLAAVALVWMQDAKVGKLYLAAALAGSLLAAAGMAVGGLLGGGEVAAPAGAAAKAAVALLMVGFAIKLALVPFYFWLPPLAENTSPMTAVLVISALDMAEVGELALLRSEAPWVFGEWQWVWIGLALLAMLGGALLALSQRSLRRMLAFSAVDDSGYLLLGIAAGGALGVGGALIGALSHALCKFLLFAALGAAEDGLGKKITLDERGLAGRFPAAGAAFLVGALGMVGVPPFLGAVGRWRLYLAGVQVGGRCAGRFDGARFGAGSAVLCARRTPRVAGNASERYCWRSRFYRARWRWN